MITKVEIINQPYSGDFIIADYYDIEKVGTRLSNKILIESPISMDNIKFNGWSNNKLLISCEVELDANTLELTVKNKQRK